MNHLELTLSGVTLGFETILCAVVCLRKLQSRLPFFTIHAALLLIGTLNVELIYYHFGFHSSAAYYAYWATAGVIVLSRGFAIAELCRHALRSYRGIWALAWRILVLMAVVFFAHAAWDAWGQPERVEIYGLTLERRFTNGWYWALSLSARPTP